MDADLGAGAANGAAGAGVGASGGSHGAGAGAPAAGAAAAGAVATAAAAPWKPNTRGRGRPRGSRDKKPRAKRARRESTASAPAPSVASGRLPGSHGPRPGSGGGAKWSDEHKGYALCVYDRSGGQLTRTVDELLRTKPEWFGAGRALRRNGQPAAALSTQLLSKWVDKRARALRGGTSSHWFDTSVGGKRAGAGRHRLIPADVLQRIVAAWNAVLSTKKTLFTTVQLRSVAIGVLVSSGLKGLLAAKHASGARVFACSRVWVARQCAAQGWRFKKPFGDSDKPPTNMHQLIRDFLLRIAYFVRVYNVPKELVINPDHTGLHYTQIKGGGWTADKDTPAVASGSDKRECTLVPCSSAAGRVCPAQIVVGGTTSLSMAQGIGKFKSARVAGAHIATDYKGYGGQLDESSLPAEHKLVPKWIHHFAGTNNHWSDLVTSIDILVYVLVPFLRREIVRCDFPADSHAILVLDCWWGWISPVFKAYVREEFPWIHLVYVPGRCTPWAQPADRGFITRIKACLRRFSAELITEMVVHQLFVEGRPPGQVNVDIKGATSCKKNLAIWVSKACEELDSKTADVQAYWSGIGKEEKITKNGLLDAWEKNVQEEAWQRREELFPKLREEVDPNGEISGDFSESVNDAADAGFGDEAPGIEQDLQAAGVLRNVTDPVSAAPPADVSYDDADAYLDDFVARLDARMAAAGTALPVAANTPEVIAEVTANVAAAATAASEEEEEDGASEEGSSEEDTDAESEEQEGAAQGDAAT